MADYAITGRKGTGKSLTAIGIIEQALKDGKRVATNFNIFLDHLMPAQNKFTTLRLPDHPSIDDFNKIGRGQTGVVEDENGIIFLDEVSHFFNARQFQDKDRAEVLAWLTQSRKRGWDVYYIMQGLPQLDKQVRETQLEYHITIKRTDKWSLPFITAATSVLFGARNAIHFPAGIFAVTRYGCERDGLVIARKFYRTKKFYTCYETQQLFRPALPQNPTKLDFERCSDGMHSVLSAWHLKGRYEKQLINANPVITALRLLVGFSYAITRTPRLKLSSLKLAKHDLTASKPQLNVIGHTYSIHKLKRSQPMQIYVDGYAIYTL